MKRLLMMLAALLALGGTVCAQEKVKTGKTVYNNVFELLRTEPGVYVAPGGGNGVMPKIYIRGVSTNSENTQPLFVVDGIITDNVTYLLPEDIYSVEVIKDGTASIYGMQGQNGVILFRTKSAVEQEKRISDEQRAAKKAARQSRRRK
ncbi:MAG: TonB-dependent receptor plug domain-containing protein [Bacteroidales bacterium]|nr:TonB-dependent receptor plug domain-containing protein [Bacteroidales bacterium]MBO7488208.1 TonB-dependent receptor plug domain-containing protein [Bacteroidales bacterium]